MLRRSIVLDLAALAGFASVMYGCHEVYAPLPWIVGGLLVGLGAVMVAKVSAAAP